MTQTNIIRGPRYTAPQYHRFLYILEVSTVSPPSLATMEKSSSFSVADEKGIRRPPRLRGVALFALSFQTLGMLSLFPVTVDILMSFQASYTLISVLDLFWSTGLQTLILYAQEHRHFTYSMAYGLHLGLFLVRKM